MRIATIATAAILAVPVSAHAAIVPEELPSQVVSVSPAQGWVDTSNNANPLGVSEITLNFRVSPEVNTECTSLVSIYVDGADTPAESVVANEVAYVDVMGFPAGAVKFKNNYVADGTYHISIPEGVFLLNGELSPAVELNYGIRTLQRLNPMPGIYEEINVIDIDIDGTNVQYNGEPISLISTSSEFSATVDIENGDTRSVVHMDFGGVTTPGDYVMLIPGGTFTYDILNDEGETERIRSQEVVVSYTVSVMPVPVITPANNSELASFETFSLEMPEGVDFLFTDTQGFSYIYAVNPDGTLPDNWTYKVKATAFNAPTFAVVDPETNQIATSPVTPPDGQYALRFANGAFCCNYDNQFVNCPPFTYYYTINHQVGVEAIEDADNALCDVYAITGVRVAHDIDREAVKNLPAGLYIVNGKKVIVR